MVELELLQRCQRAVTLLGQRDPLPLVLGRLVEPVVGGSAGRGGTARPRAARTRRRGARRARATSALRGRVLRRALRHERVRLGDERAVRVAAVDDDVAAELELVGHAAAVDDRDARVAVDVGDAEAQPVRRVAGALHRADDAADERDQALVALQLARRELRGAAAGDRDVEQEDREHRRDREREHETDRTRVPGHAGIVRAAC